MALRRIVFEYLGVSVDVSEASVERNLIFRAACMTYVQPYSLAAQVGRLGDDVATEALAKAYAAGVVAGSPDPALADLDEQGWVRWLLSHPEEFDQIRAICEHPDNFKNLGVSRELRATGPSPQCFGTPSGTAS